MNIPFSMTGNAARAQALRLCLLLAFLPLRAPAETLYAVVLDQGHSLVRFDSEAPGLLESSVPISGVQGYIHAIDFRPLTEELFAISAVDLLPSPNLEAVVYRIAIESGQAALFSGPILIPGPSNDVALTFDEDLDLLRVVAVGGANLLVDPDSGDFWEVTSLNPAASAYAMGFDGGGTTYLVDPLAGNLVRLGGVGGSPSANGGETEVVGPLGISLPKNPCCAGFDIAATGQAFLAIEVAGSPELGPISTPQLFSVDLVTGQATGLGSIGSDPGASAMALAVAPASSGSSPVAVPAVGRLGLLVLLASIAVSGALTLRNQAAHRGRRSEAGA